MAGGEGKRSKSNGVYVALLRGINVGGKNRLPMSDLTALFNDAGCCNVRTYIQSGNVAFGAEEDLARRIPAIISQALLDRHGLKVPVVTRDLDALLTVAGSNPFLSAGTDPAALHVAFLADKPDPSRVASLDPERSPQDQFIVRDSEIFLHCPNGMARSKLTNAYFDSRLGTTSTVRNWRTVLKLIELAEGS